MLVSITQAMTVQSPGEPGSQQGLVAGDVGSVFEILGSGAKIANMDDMGSAHASAGGAIFNSYGGFEGWGSNGLAGASKSDIARVIDTVTGGNQSNAQVQQEAAAVKADLVAERAASSPKTANSSPVEVTLPKFLVLAKKELSEDDKLTAAKILYGEVGLFRPSARVGPGDAADLHDLYRKIAGIILYTNNKVSKPRDPDLNDPLVAAMFYDMRTAINNPINPGSQTQFVLWNSSDGGHSPASGMNQQWPYLYVNNITAAVGPFIQVYPRNTPKQYGFFYSGNKGSKLGNRRF